MTVSKGDKLPEVAPDHPDWSLGSMLLMEALGTWSASIFCRDSCSSWPMPARGVVKSTRLDLILFEVSSSEISSQRDASVWDAASKTSAK